MTRGALVGALLHWQALGWKAPMARAWGRRIDGHGRWTTPKGPKLTRLAPVRPLGVTSGWPSQSNLLPEP